MLTHLALLARFSAPPAPQQAPAHLFSTLSDTPLRLSTVNQCLESATQVAIHAPRTTPAHARSASQDFI